ncbi:MAG: signal peptidase II [Dehalococcoidia bacterium]|nr:signal peptidase II [Dehalococcoidia bacterium]
MEDASAREPTRPGGRAQLRPRDAWFLVLAAVAVALDQLTKAMIVAWLDRGDSVPEEGLIRIVHITNSGAAFGMLQGAGPLLAITSIVGMAAILVYLFAPGFANPIMRIGLALMLGGAIGNLIDRVRNGEVVDFVKVPNFPAFNVADSCITVGVIILMWALLWETKTEPDGENS